MRYIVWHTFVAFATSANRNAEHIGNEARKVTSKSSPSKSGSGGLAASVMLAFFSRSRVRERSCSSRNEITFVAKGANQHVASRHLPAVVRRARKVRASADDMGDVGPTGVAVVGMSAIMGTQGENDGNNESVG